MYMIDILIFKLYYIIHKLVEIFTFGQLICKAIFK